MAEENPDLAQEVATSDADGVKPPDEDDIVDGEIVDGEVVEGEIVVPEHWKSTITPS